MVSKLQQRLIFDKLAFTYPIDSKKRMALFDKINQPEFYGVYNRKVYGNTKGRYKNNYQFEIYQGNTIELSLYPCNTQHNFLRVEFNPDKLGKEGGIELRRFLIKLLGLKEVKRIYFHAQVTRLDLTLDILNMEPNLYLHMDKVRQSSIERNKAQVITSQVVGSGNSDLRVTLYDKDIEQGNDRAGLHKQRVELRFRKLNCTMAELNADLLSQFERLNFYCPDFINSKRFSKRFKNTAYNDGLNTALTQSDDNRRRRYRRRLEDFRIEPIDHQTLNFESTKKQALGHFIHRGYRDFFYGQNKESA
jgi:hypothetical protein